MIKSKQQKVSASDLQLKTKRKYLSQEIDSDFQAEMKCDQTFDEISNFVQKDGSKKDDRDCLRSCVCGQCFFYMKKSQNNPNQDAEERRRQKRRQYKKRQKLKIQQKKQQALRDLATIISELYALRTDAKKEIQRIENCLSLIEKNEIRFYQFINAVIRQQVEAIKKQMRICLSQLAAEPPNFSKVPRLYQQFEKVNNASLQVEFIINYFNKIMAEKKRQAPSYHKDLDKQTFKYLLDSDQYNKQYFSKVKNLVLNEDIKYEREKQMLKIMIQIVNEKKLKNSYYSKNGYESDSDHSNSDYYENQEENRTSYSEEDGQYGRYYQDEYYSEDYPHTENTTKSSQKQYEEQGYFEQNEDMQKSQRNKNLRRRRKNKNIKAYQVSFQRTYETLIQLQKSLNHKKDDKLPCNLQEDWLEKFKDKFLTKKSISKK